MNARINPQRIGKRTTMVERDNGIAIHIRAPRHLWLLIFLPVWLVPWTFGGISALLVLAAGEAPEGPPGFLALFLCFWLIAEVFALYVMLWMAFGKEVVTIRNGVLSVKRDVMGCGPTRRMPLSELRNLRASGYFGFPMTFSYTFRWWGLSGGTIAVDYRGKPYRFGIALDEQQANAVVGELRPHLEANTEPAHSADRCR
jgi:hypothetical protein